MTKLINLDTNESVEINTYGSDKIIFVPATLLYWGLTAKLAIDRDGILIRGSANQEEFLTHVEECFRVPIRTLIGAKATRPFVANGKRVFAIDDKRTSRMIEDGAVDC
jgi:hypothetical protein